jgi:F-type H+-transporting ATPase subunit delta
MKISKQARRDAKQLFRACMADGLLDEARVRQAVSAVIERKPRGQMGILHHFKRLVKLDVERRTARVVSAVPLSGALRDSVSANLARRYGQGLNISFAEDAGLVGGLRVQVGSDVFDGTVASRLTALDETF